MKVNTATLLFSRQPLLTVAARNRRSAVTAPHRAATKRSGCALCLAVILLLPSIAPAAQPADLSRIEAEPNPEKRARAALDNADEALREAKDAYAAGDRAAASSRLEEVEQSVDLADRSLKQTGKNPSRSPKYFKLAELRTRELLRKLDGFRDQMSAADRPPLDRVMAAVQKVHDALLEGIMGRRK